MSAQVTSTVAQGLRFDDLPIGQSRVRSGGHGLSTGQDEFLTVADVARILKLNQQTVRNWIDEGRLPAVHLGRRVRVRREDFDAFVERGRTTPAAARGRSPAQAFWDGDLLPAPMVDPAEGG